MEKKKKSHLSPEAARILEQYRNAGKTPANSEGGVPGETGSAPKPSTPPPPTVRQRSGTRGK